MLDSLEEVSQRSLDLLHLLLNTNDTLLELLSNVGCARVTLAFGNQDLLSLDVRDFFLLELDIVVGWPLVDHLDVRVLVAHDFILDGALVPMLGLVLDILVDEGILGEDLAHQELLWKSKGLNVCLGNVHKLSLRVAAKIVVAEERVGADLMRDLERFPLKWLLIGMEPNANCSIEDEVHLKDFFLLVVDDLLVFLLWKVTRLQTESHIVQKFAVLVFLRVEEESEVVEYVVEQVVNNDTTLDLSR